MPTVRRPALARTARSHHDDNAPPRLVAILNLTFDSFSGDGLGASVEDAVAKGCAMVDAGADVLDIGAESTRPGAIAVDAAVEQARVMPVIAALSQVVACLIAIDTRRPATAEMALCAGATMVNDTSGTASPEMAAVVMRHGALWVLMHAPQAIGQMAWSQAGPTMETDTVAGVARVVADLRAMVDAAVAAGVDGANLVVDPGLGFGKTVGQNLAFLRPVDALVSLGVPVYLGPSRKSFLGHVSGRDVEARLAATAAAVTAAVLAGARYIRVHDVAAMRDVIDVAWAICSGDDRPAAARGRPWAMSR